MYNSVFHLEIHSSPLLYTIMGEVRRTHNLVLTAMFISAMRGVKRPFVTATLAWEAMASWPLRLFHTSRRKMAQCFQSKSRSKYRIQGRKSRDVLDSVQEPTLFAGSGEMRRGERSSLITILLDPSRILESGPILASGHRKQPFTRLAWWTSVQAASKTAKLMKRNLSNHPAE